MHHHNHNSVAITYLSLLLLCRATRLHKPHGWFDQKHDPDIILETCPFGWKEGCELWTCSFSISIAHLGFYCKTCCMKYSEFSENWSDGLEWGFFPVFSYLPLRLVSSNQSHCNIWCQCVQITLHCSSLTSIYKLYIIPIWYFICVPITL